MTDQIDVIPNIIDHPEVVWWDCGCEIICSCGNHIILNDNERELCDCGIVWLLETHLKKEKVNI